MGSESRCDLIFGRRYSAAWRIMELEHFGVVATGPIELTDEMRWAEGVC